MLNAEFLEPCYLDIHNSAFIIQHYYYSPKYTPMTTTANIRHTTQV